MGTISCCDANQAGKLNEIIVEDEQFHNLKAASPVSKTPAEAIYPPQAAQIQVQKESSSRPSDQRSPASNAMLVQDDDSDPHGGFLRPSRGSDESGEIQNVLNISRRSFMAYSDQDEAYTPIKSDAELQNFDKDADSEPQDSEGRPNDGFPLIKHEDQASGDFYSAQEVVENSSKDDDKITVEVQDWDYEANDPLIDDDDSQQSPETVIEVLNEEILDFQPLAIAPVQAAAPPVEPVIDQPNAQEGMLSDTVEHITKEDEPSQDSMQKVSSKSESAEMSEIHMARPAVTSSQSESSIVMSPRDEGEMLINRSVDLGDGKYYSGQWSVQGKKHGTGKFNWPDGSHYEGEWQNDMANGWGVLVHSDGDVYTGNWKDDKAHGFGNYQHTDGAHYTGQWIEDKQHGLGREVWPDGAFFEGHYYNGLKHGYGLFSWADGSRYAGGFFNNNIEGCGQYDWADGRRYIGGWHDNKMHGNGDFLWPDGRQYTGAYRDDTKMGFGIFRWPDGRRYEGNWEKGKQHGKGKFVSNNGEERQGIWESGKRIHWVNN